MTIEKLKILIVDDDPNFKLFLCRTLKEWGHDVITADDGLEALSILKKEPIRLVISDWMMPEMDGVQLCKNIRRWKNEDYIYFIMVTTKSAQQDLLAGRGAGADDFLSKSFDTDELKVCLRTGVRILNLQSALKEKNESLNIAYENVNNSYKIIEEDLSAASKMQERLLPCSGKIGGIDFQWMFKPAGFVAGDTFNYFPLDDENIAFYMIDVSGHGVPSALLSVTLQQILKPVSEGGRSLLFQPTQNNKEALFNPAEVMHNLNQRFQMKGEDQQYFTMVYGVVNQKEKRLKFSLAGHPLPIIQSSAGMKTVGKGATPIGWIPDAEYEEFEVLINQGDRVFIYSDGVTDCLLAGNENLAPKPLNTIIEKSKRQPLTKLITNLKKRSSDLEKCGKIEDDISFLAFEVS